MRKTDGPDHAALRSACSAIYVRTRSATCMVGLDAPETHASHVDQLALIAERKTDCGERPTRAAYASISEMNCSMQAWIGDISP